VSLASRALLALLAVALLPIAPIAAKPPVKQAAARDWSQSFAVSPIGGFVMGNPKAKVKVVEYGSLTCPHCRHFAQDAVKKFTAQYVRTGRASYEFRPMVLNSTDLAAVLVARCAGPSRFFPMADTLYATQPTWMARTADVTDADLAKIPDNQIALRMAERAQLFGVARANGVPPARARACLLDSAAQTRVAKIYQSAIDLGVPGTPFFLITGRNAPVWNWATLQQELRKAGA
jgi:protein-disulfide isomerase